MLRKPEKSVQCFSFRKPKQLPLSRPAIAGIVGNSVQQLSITSSTQSNLREKRTAVIWISQQEVANSSPALISVSVRF